MQTRRVSPVKVQTHLTHFKQSNFYFHAAVWKQQPDLSSDELPRLEAALLSRLPADLLPSIYQFFLNISFSKAVGGCDLKGGLNILKAFFV